MLAHCQQEVAVKQGIQTDIPRKWPGANETSLTKERANQQKNASDQ
jgi:hypothetical protein